MSAFPFHMAFPVQDLNTTRTFYCNILGCVEGRSTDRWIDFDFFGNQLSAHLHPEMKIDSKTTEVDNKKVPLHHFGAVLPFLDWLQLVERLKINEIKFVIEPQIRFQGQPGEQGTVFFLDPSGNALEFKGFKDASKIFANH